MKRIMTHNMTEVTCPMVLNVASW